MLSWSQIAPAKGPGPQVAPQRPRLKAGAVALIGLAFPAGPIAAQEGPSGNPQAGRQVAGMCRTCHGIDGFAKIPIAPHIGGEPVTYLVNQLTAFRGGDRVHEMMTVVASGLSDGQIADVSAWYASQQAQAVLTADPESAPELCSGCHGVDGIALVEDAPNLAGETNIYIDTQLKAFKRGKRVHEVMTPIAEGLTNAEIRTIADWYADIEFSVTPPAD